jgi:hypothetical protein
VSEQTYINSLIVCVEDNTHTHTNKQQKEREKRLIPPENKIQFNCDSSFQGTLKLKRRRRERRENSSTLRIPNSQSQIEISNRR